MQLVVGGLLSPEEDRSLLLSQFREYLEHDDIRYHTMQAASDTVARAKILYTVKGYTVGELWPYAACFWK